MTVSIVPPEATAAVLTQVRPMIEKALARRQGDRTTVTIRVVTDS